MTADAKTLDAIEEEIPLAELCHDVAVEESQVQALMQSLQDMGQLSPVLIRAETYEVIDGFHRIEAMRRLGWEMAHCRLIACSQEEFEDARLTSALSHKSVSYARIGLWAIEIFKSTPWARLYKCSEAFRLAGSGYGTANGDFVSVGTADLMDRGLSGEEWHGLIRWGRQRAKTWGVSPAEVARVVELAEQAHPEVIQMIRTVERRGLRARRGSLLPTEAEAIIGSVPDQEDQRATAIKAATEGLRANDISQFSSALNAADTKEEKQELLQTPWRELRFRPDIAPDPTEQKLKRCAELARNLRGSMSGLAVLGTESKPKAKQEFDEALADLSLAIAKYRGDTADDYSRLMDENKNLKMERDRLRQSLEDMRRGAGLAQKIYQDELALRSER